MAYKLSSEEIDELRRDVAAAEPYPDDAPEFDMIDGSIDYARVRATLAKGILERHNIPLTV